MALPGSLQLPHDLGLCRNQGCNKMHLRVMGRKESYYQAQLLQAVFQSYSGLQSSPPIAKLIPAVGVIIFALCGVGSLLCQARNLLTHSSDGSWKKSRTHYVVASYLQPLLLWTGALLICRALDPVLLPTETGQVVKRRLLSFVRSLSTVLAFAYCLSSVIQQAQKFFVESADTNETRNMGFQFAGKAVYSAVWIAAFSIFMELLGFSTQKWITAGGLGTVLLTLAGREHVGWWSPTIIIGEDREAIHIPNHKFTVNVVRNLSQKTHWRIKTYLAISHSDVNKINNIVANMRKVLAKNPLVEQQRLHRRVFLEYINPENQALMAWTDVKLTSPQLSREGMYKLALKNLIIQCVSSSETRNPFVEHAVQYCVAAAYAIFDKDKRDLLHKLLLRGLDITILGCNDFYSYRNQIEGRGLPLMPESLATLPPFSSITFNTEEANQGNCKPEVAKTGLGSSAAMTTAVVSALLHYLGVVKLSSSKDSQERKDTVDLDTMHIIAQTAHCIAQGKVGSGFDVSSAVYGSQHYVRFSPEVISSAQIAANGVPLPEVIADILKGKWDHERLEFSLPPLMNLLLGEPGSGGSSTPSMVGAVKKWQKCDPEKALETRRRLSEANSALERQLNLLRKLAKEQWDVYKCVINICGRLRSEKMQSAAVDPAVLTWIEEASEPNKEVVIKALLGAKEAMLGIRHHMRLMGEAAGVPIEPEPQTQLLDTTMNLEGVLLAGVPGAGGFDAVFAITLGDSSTNVTNLWSSQNVLALLVTEDPRGVSLESSDPRTSEMTSAVSSMHIE